MNETGSKVSIVLPTYNGAKYIRQSIDSCLNQTYSNIELVIVDDCSTDNTAEIVRSYTDERIRYIRNETNLRLPCSLNVGFKNSTGEYLTWTSDDNFYDKEAIMGMLTFLKNNNADFVYCDYFVFENDSLEDKRNGEGSYSDISLHNCVGACFLYSRNVKQVIGEYDPDMELLEDYDYWVRVSKKFTLNHIKEAFYYYRFHPKSLWCSRREEIRVIEFLFKLKHQFMPKDKVNWYLRDLMVRNSGYFSKRIKQFFINIFLKKRINSILDSFVDRKLSFTKTRKELNKIINRDILNHKDK